MDAIKLLGIATSPRKGNSLYLLEEAFKIVHDSIIPVEVTKISFTGKKY